MREFDLQLPGRRTLHAYDAGPTGVPDELVVFWHGGTPNIGEPPAPLLAEAAALGLRFVGADRPGYGGSSRVPGAEVSGIADDVRAVLDALEIERFATLGHSGGGPRALACAALLGHRVVRAVAMSSPAPPDATGFDRFASMAPGIVREQRAAIAGREALTVVLAADEWDGSAFTPGDYAALEGDWAWFAGIVQAATAGGPDGQIDDLLAAARPWGFDPAATDVPVLLVHGTADCMVPASHSAWLASAVRGSTLRTVDGGGHIDVLRTAPDVLAWLRGRVSPGVA